MDTVLLQKVIVGNQLLQILFSRPQIRRQQHYIGKLGYDLDYRYNEIEKRIYKNGGSVIAVFNGEAQLSQLVLQRKFLRLVRWSVLQGEQPIAVFGVLPQLCVDTVFRKADVIQPHGTLPMLCLDRKAHRIKGVSECIELTFKFSWAGRKGQTVFHILPQIVSVGFLAGLVDPVLFLLALGVEIAAFEDGQLVFPADLIGDFSQLLVVADFVFELCAVLEGHRIYNKVAMHIVGVQVDGDEHLILISPHPSCGFLANGKRLLRRYLALTEALNAVVADDFSTQTEPPLDGDHLGVGVLRRAVDTAHKHLAVGLIVVLCVTQGGVQILVQIFRCGGFAGIVGVVQRGFQIFEHRPKACHRHTASPLSRQQEFCCDLLQHRTNFLVQLRRTGFIRKLTQLFNTSKKSVRRNRSRLIPQRSLLHIFSCTQPAFSGLCLNLLFFHCRNSYGNSYILSHAHLSFRGIGGLRPQRVSRFRL